MKMTEVRSTQPLSDDDFAAIRANVMSTIAARNERRALPIPMRFAIAAAVVIAVGIAFVTQRPALRPAVVSKPAAAIKTAHAAPPPPVAPSISAVTPQPIARVAHRPEHRPARHPEYQNIRMEFRTSDPDIRIIWIASQTTTTTGGKS
jgi:hypothetical protein